MEVSYMGGIKDYHLKSSEELSPDDVAALNYEREIANLERLVAEANAAHDWSKRNWYSNMLNAKRKNLEILLTKMGGRTYGQ